MLREVGLEAVSLNRYARPSLLYGNRALAQEAVQRDRRDLSHFVCSDTFPTVGSWVRGSPEVLHPVRHPSLAMGVATRPGSFPGDECAEAELPGGRHLGR